MKMYFVLFLMLSPAGLSFAEKTAVQDFKMSYAKPELPPAASAEQVGLGRLLFFDPRLSSSGIYSCVSCHNPALGWEDGLPKAVGLGQKVLARKVPTVLNLAWSDAFAWDGRAATLEEMSKIPILHPAIFATTFPAMEKFLKSVPEYVRRFKLAYPKEQIGESTILKALAAYQRTLVSSPAPFDRWIAGDEKAISAQAKKGFALFNGKAKCAECHAGWRFTDLSFQDIGLADADVGRGAILKMAKMQHAFKVPTLRDVGRRAPYMHNGSQATLADVVKYYDRGGDQQRPSLSRLIVPLHLSSRERADVVAFLETLNSDLVETTIPLLPPIGEK